MKSKILFHCGNAPKMQRAIDVSLAIAKRDFAALKPHVREDFTWQTIGEGSIVAYGDMSSALKSKKAVDTIEVDNALSHGNGAMADGTLTFAGGKTVRFCHVLLFVNTAKDALAKKVHTYMIEV